MANIADIYVTLLPETSRISDGIVRAFREVDPKAREAGRRWGQEIQRGLNDTKVELKADTSKAKTELDEAARDRKSTVEVDADTGKARAEIDAAARNRTAHINVDADTMRSSVERTMSQVGPQMGASVTSSLPSAGEQAATQVGSSLSAAMGPVGATLAAELIAGAAAAASALSGVIGLIPAGLAGAGGVVATLATGLDGVKDAWDAAGKAADSATKDQAEKTKAVTSAQRSLQNAVLDEATAQRDVANARKDARQQLEDLNVQMRGGVLDEKEAILGAEAARRDLATGRFKDSIEYQQAQLRVEQADQRVLEAHQRNVELQDKATDANAKGVDQSDQVVAANQRLAKAHEDVTVAQQNLTEAQSKQSSTAEAFATAMGKLSPNAQALITTLQALKPAWDAVKFSVQDSLFAGIGPELQRLATQYLPVLKTAMSGLAGTMNTAFKDIGTWLSKPEVMAQIKEIVANIGTSFQNWAQSIVPFSQAFLTITQVGSGFLPQLGKAITEGANAFNNFIQQAAKSGELHNWMQTGIQALGELIKMLPTVLRMFVDLAPAGIPVLQTIGGLLRTMEPAVRVLGITMGASQTGINLMWGALGKVADKCIELARVVWPPLQQMLHTLEQTFQRVWNTISKVVESAWKIIKPIFDGINIGGTNLRQILDMVSKLPGMGSFAPPPIAGTPTMPGVTPSGGAVGGDGASLPSLSSLRGNGLTMPFPGAPLPTLSSLRPGKRPWLLHDPNFPDMPGAAGAAPSGLSGDSSLATALAAKGFTPEQIRLIQAFSSVEGKNPAGVPTLGFTDAQLGGRSDLQAHIDALAKQFQDRAGVAGPFPAGGSDQQQAEWIAKVVGQTGSSSDWQGNAQPKDYVQRVIAAMGGGGPSTPYMPTVPSAAMPSGGMPGYGGDASLLANVPAGKYLQTQAADLTKGIGDCSSAVEDLINMMDGVSTAGRQMSTGNASQWLTAHGFVPTNTPMPGTFQVGFSSSHMQATLPGGTNFNWGSDAAAGNRGIGGTGAWDPSFTQHYYRPAGMYPSAAGMPTIAAPQGVSPDGIPLGTQQSPMYVAPAQAPSGGQQLGQDMLSGIMEMFGIDGSLFKNPMDTGLFKGFKGFMSFATGLLGGGKGQGMPASYYAGGGGGGMPGGGGGGDLFAGLGEMLQGIMPQPFGQPTIGGPAQAPDEFNPMIPGSGGKTGLPPNFTPSGNQGGPGGNTVDNRIQIGTVNGNMPPSIHQELNNVNVPRARQQLSTGLPGG